MLKKIVLFLIIASALFAQTAEEAVTLLEDQPGFGIRAAALGNAYTGVADDYSAIYWNPAGLAQIQTNQLSAGLSHLKFSSTAEYLNQSTDGDRNFTKLQSFGMVYPFAVERGSLVMAFGYQKVKSLDSFLEFTGYFPDNASNRLGFDISTEYLDDYYGLEFDRDFSQTKTTSQEGSLNQWSFGMAMDLSPRFSAGFSVNLITGGSEYNARYQQDDVNNANIYELLNENNATVAELQFLHYEDNQQLKSSYSGIQAQLGGMYRIGDALQLGGMITLPSVIRVDEVWGSSYSYNYEILDYADNSIYPYLVEEDLGSGEFDYNIKAPFKFSGGLSLRRSIFLLSAAAEYSDWSQLRYEMPDDRNSEDYSALLNQNEFFSSDYQAVLSWGLGAEINLMRNTLSLRGGYRSVPSPVKDAKDSYNKEYFTAGLGFKLDEGTYLDVAYILGDSEREAYYSYDWDEYSDINPMQTVEKYKTRKLLAGIKLLF